MKWKTLSVDAVRVSIIGAGNMGRALALMLLNAKKNKFEITLVARNISPELTSFANENYIKLADSIDIESKIVFLAVKPKDFESLKNYFVKDVYNFSLVVSFITGVRIFRIEQLVSSRAKAVRFMSNLSISNGKGVACYYTNQTLDSGDQSLLSLVSENVGHCLEVQDEGLLDSATAIIGSFPALIYRLLDSAENAAINMGFSSENASQLIKKVALGSIENAQNANFDSLISKIATKGGTTEAMLNNLGPSFVETIKGSLEVASKKAKHLGE